VNASSQAGVAPHERWEEYFQSLAASGIHLGATVEVARVSLSPGRAERGWPASRVDNTLLAGIRYDRGRDEIEVSLRRPLGTAPAIRLFLPEPRDVRVVEQGSEKRVHVTDARGGCTVITLMELPDAQPDGPPVRLVGG
jgi:hypothetical protein